MANMRMKHNKVHDHIAAHQPSAMGGCDFCAEIDGRGGTLFSERYSPLLRTRIVARNHPFVAMPTMGQIFPGSILILPEMHVETLASLSAAHLQVLDEFAHSLGAVIAKYENLALFEHGAHATTGGSCGIYHAHLHAVPLPEPLDVARVLPKHYSPAPTLTHALSELSDSSQYLVFASEAGCGYVDISDESAFYPSQYFRRRLADLFHPGTAWNWREFDVRERALIATIELFRGPHVPQ
jgi:diadenosine tetraphosphate (Ap4A) HIT family hydrolase